MFNKVKNRLVFLLFGVCFVAFAEEQSTISLTDAGVETIVNLWTINKHVRVDTTEKVVLKFKIINNDPDRRLSIKQQCKISYDQKERWIFQNYPTPPEIIESYVLNNDGFLVFYKGESDGYIKFFRNNATIEKIECKLIGYEFQEESPISKFFRTLFSSN